MNNDNNLEFCIAGVNCRAGYATVYTWDRFVPYMEVGDTFMPYMEVSFHLACNENFVR